MLLLWFAGIGFAAYRRKLFNSKPANHPGDCRLVVDPHVCPADPLFKEEIMR